MSLSQQAYHLLRQKIVTLELPPGALFTEARLLRILPFGRTPIREAMQRLEREQLVQIIPRRGMLVNEIDLGDLQRLFEVRMALEALAVKLAAARAEPDLWDAMEDELAALAACCPDDAVNLLDHDHACHAIFWSGADNKFLEETLTVLYFLSLRLWHYAMPPMTNLDLAVQEHRTILEAVRAGAPDRAAQLMQEHIGKFQDNIQTAIKARLVAVPDQQEKDA